MQVGIDYTVFLFIVNYIFTLKVLLLQIVVFPTYKFLVLLKILRGCYSIGFNGTSRSNLDWVIDVARVMALKTKLGENTNWNPFCVEGR